VRDGGSFRFRGAAARCHLIFGLQRPGPAAAAGRQAQTWRGLRPPPPPSARQGAGLRAGFGAKFYRSAG